MATFFGLATPPTSYGGYGGEHLLLLLLWPPLLSKP